MNNPTLDLIALLKRKKLDSLALELEEGITTFDECKVRTKNDWKEVVGPIFGIDIYNYLNPAVKEVAHVSKKVRVTDWKWKPEPPMVYSLETETMFFVNRSHAIKRLHELHKAKYSRAKSCVGGTWIIPIADNVLGLGKSNFALHYIPKSRELWKDVDQRTEFQKTLMACRTVHITFDNSVLLDKSSFDKVTLKYLVNALNELFIVPPDILSNVVSSDPNSTAFFLDELVAQVGPLLIVLDEIGAAFEDEGLNDIEKREIFLSFCRDIVGKWLSRENVFFVLLGRGSFLGYVGARPTDLKITSSNFKFERLNIHLLRKEAIKLILENTQVVENDKTTVHQKLGLSDEETTQVASALFEKTNGHPRSILTALLSCHSFSELINYHEPIEFAEKTLFYNTLFNYKGVVAELFKLMEIGSEVDLTKCFRDVGCKSINYDTIANNCFISWDGTVTKARLYANPLIKSNLENYLLPCKEYLRNVGNISKVSLDYPTVFEWMFLKRFQELFSNKQKPREIHPLFFDTPVFGKLSDLSFSDLARPFPKITRNGERHANIDDETALLMTGNL